MLVVLGLLLTVLVKSARVVVRFQDQPPALLLKALQMVDNARGGFTHVPSTPAGKALRMYHLGVATHEEMGVLQHYFAEVKAGLLRKERAGGSDRAGTSLEYPGRLAPTQLFFVVSFPGIYEAAWKRMTEGAYALVMSCACVFFQDTEGGVNGKHACDERGCRCDLLAKCAPNQARPQIGTTFTNWKGEQQHGSWDGNKPSWGCRWEKLWECNVEAALACEQLPIVVYQTDREFDGVTGVHMGLGNAQYGARLHNYNTGGGEGGATQQNAARLHNSYNCPCYKT